MCFSTAASFGAGALLTGAGIMAARRVKTPAQRAFAAIPGIFALQQFSEGFVWLSLSDGAYARWTQPSAFIFLFIAEVLWPAWMPFAMLLLEKDKWRRRILFSLLGLGLVISAHSLYCLLYYPHGAQIVEHHIQYRLEFPTSWLTFLVIAYGLATAGPTFFSSLPKMWMLGLPIVVSFFFSQVFYPDYIVSVWCFFAAIISVVAVYLLSERHKRNTVKP